MTNLRNIRHISAVIFLIAALLFVLLQSRLPWLAFVEKVQLIPSMLMATLGATIVWIVVTYLFGRLYCSAVCPIGIIQDVLIALRRRSRRPLLFSYKQPSNAWRYNILLVYVVSLIAGITIIPLILEPWNMLRNAAGIVIPGDTPSVWAKIGHGALIAALAGGVTMIGVCVWALLAGRDFCNTVCPLGTAMGLVGDRSLYVVAFDPDKCINCMKCEVVCKASCIKVAGRVVDNSRCVRCFDCVAACPNKAITFTHRRPRAATPLMTPVKS